ncbi:MAG: hypothetical protein K2X82_08360 [Gemmataceae bacterium]|nr:hypothetical protein [Gemmataceae bacterium]
MSKLDRPANLPVKAVAVSGNRKTGPVSATYVAGSTCPETCPFKGGGCYGETGHVGIIARRLNAAPVDDGDTVGTLEAAMIDALPARLDLRLHVYGDYADAAHAARVALAASRYASRGAKLGRTLAVWTYTHRWREIARPAFGKVSVLASCETEEQLSQAHRLGFAAALTVAEFAPGNGAWTTHNGFTVVPCPNQTRGKECVDCRLCFDDARNHKAGVVIGFRANNNNTRPRFVRSLEMAADNGS